MQKIRITLLVPRQQNASHPYALELRYPYSLPDQEITLTEVRFIDGNGKRATEEKTWGAYHPEEWRTATPQEQQEYLQRIGTPQPWFHTLHRTYRSVFDFSGSGDHETNNGQTWPDVDAEWEQEEKLRNQFQVEEEAWRERVKGEMLRRFERWGEG